jgi:hypothetical protein
LVLVLVEDVVWLVAFICENVTLVLLLVIEHVPLVLALVVEDVCSYLRDRRYLGFGWLDCY